MTEVKPNQIALITHEKLDKEITKQIYKFFVNLKIKNEDYLDILVVTQKLNGDTTQQQIK